MAYKFTFDETRLGDFQLSAESYRLIQHGLVALEVEIAKWNRLALQKGAKTAPYAQEVSTIKDMIAYGHTKLRERTGRVWINGISIGSMRILRAGLELSIRTKRQEVARLRSEGWPAGALAAVVESAEELEELAAQLKVEPAEIIWEVLAEGVSENLAEQVRSEGEDRWDVFVSHASEDKEGFVRPLAAALEAAGLTVWYDELSLKIGDSLRRSIDRGLSRSRYGIVVLSPSFFAKEWPQKELDGLVAREIDGTKVILPIWHQLTAAQLRNYSPTLADRVAADSSEGLEKVVPKILRAVGRDA